jgi:hypothetical protein
MVKEVINLLVRGMGGFSTSLSPAKTREHATIGRDLSTELAFLSVLTLPFLRWESGILIYDALEPEIFIIVLAQIESGRHRGDPEAIHVMSEPFCVYVLMQYASVGSAIIIHGMVFQWEYELFR